MSGPWHPTGRARVNARSPQAIGVCVRCGFWYNRVDLVPQFQWAGPKLQNLELYVCRVECLDDPQPQLKSIVIPPDPVPVWKAFPEPYTQDEPNFVATEQPPFFGSDITTETGDDLLWENETTPLPDPNNPALYPS